MRVRYSAIPVVVAPHGLALGGGCELTLHADRVQATAELYTGLVEFGVGLIPGGGGTKEMAKRAAAFTQAGDVELNNLQRLYMNVATARVSTSANEAFDQCILQTGDRISINRDKQITDAKQLALLLAEAGYTQPLPSLIKVQGKTGLANLLVGINSMSMGGYITEHDNKIASKLAHVICGGALSSPQLVSEQYLLDLEREAFLSLCGEAKTQERIAGVLNGKPAVRN